MSANLNVTVPNSWCHAELGALVHIHYGRALPERDRDSSGTHPVIASGGYVGKHSTALVDGPCLVVGRKGAAGAIHYVAQSSWPIDTAYFIQPPLGISLKYLYYFLASMHLAQLDKSTAIPSLSRDDLNRVVVAVAPTIEQHRITGMLDELLSHVESATADLWFAKRKLTSYRQSLLKAALEGALTTEWRTQALQAATAMSTGDRKGWATTPDSWQWSTAEALCGFITKGTTPPKSLTSEDAKCVPFLRVTNLTHDGSLNFRDQVFVAEDVHRKFLARSIVKPGDVLMNIVGPPLGQVSLVPSTFPEWNVNQAIAIFRVQHSLLNEYLAYVLLSPGAGQWLQARAKTTAGQTNLTLEVCRALPVPVPPLAEQTEIVRLLNQQLDALSDQGRAIDHAMAMASAQRQNILRAAFSGQLVPQDPNDEPASVLLERIRAHRQPLSSRHAPARRPRRASC